MRRDGRTFGHDARVGRAWTVRTGNTPGWDRTNGQPLRRRLLYPLSYGGMNMGRKRETRFELATSNLEGWHSTTELLPRTLIIYHDCASDVKGTSAQRALCVYNR